MKLKMLSWNVRGANNLNKRNVIRNFIRSQRVDLVCLQETKLKNLSAADARSFGVGRMADWRAVGAEGSAGGMLVFWDKRKLDLVEAEIGQFSVTCMFKNVEDGFLWAFTGVYGPVKRCRREMFWEELGAVKGLWEGPWCIGGDFNMVLYPNERKLDCRLSHSMRRFSEVLNELGLRDLPLQGGPFTWRGGLNNQRMSRLDRFLITADLENQFCNVTQRTLPRPVSDHCPVMLDCDGIRSGPSPFRFENMWLKYAGFKDTLRDWWQSLHFSGSYSFILASKLKALKGILKNWNFEVFGRVENNKKEALNRISYWDEVEKVKVLSLEEAEKRDKAREEFKEWVDMEEISWRQKSREIWLKEGDRNTGFFHRMANSHRRRKSISSISINGRRLVEEVEVRDGLVDAYQSLLSASNNWCPPYPDLHLNLIGADQSAKLEEMFTEEEVLAAVSGLNNDKAPGPDGFPIAFWSFSWDFVKEEVMGFFRDFFQNEQFVKSLNTTFLVLVPKGSAVEDLKDLRPISLVGSLYKILSKVLANRIKKVMVLIISQSQNAFVEGRQILDAVLIANEVVDSALRKKENGLLCKLDIEKAYDHIGWDFLLLTLEKMGFGPKWIRWIRWCISTASFSVLFNGSPTGFFQSSRGLRQGDPLSPYLFVIGMEVLSCMLKRAVEGNFISGCRLRNSEGGELVISHLLYADDTIVFCEANSEQLMCLSWTLMWFEAFSGLKINLNKSEIIPLGRVDNVESLAVELGCRVGVLPTMYLGLPLGAPQRALGVWDSVEERFRKRLSSWKRQYISKGGRLTLIRSTLSSLPIYFLSLFRMPKRVCARLEKIQRDFLWGGGNLDRKPHLVNWKTVCLAKSRGGLGVRGLSVMNQALLCKWCWRFANERDSLWRMVISTKFGEEAGGWHTRDIRGGFGTGVWKDIRKVWLLFSHNAIPSLGNGRRLGFWKDPWGDETVLSQAFPTLFNLAAQKDARVAEVWDSSHEVGVWSPVFLRPFNDWELDEVERFFFFLHNKKIRSVQEDRLLLKDSNSDGFSVRHMYCKLMFSPPFDFPSRSIWNPIVPPKLGFFAWEASWGKVLTLDQLKRRGIPLANRCFLCEEFEETIDHLLIHCARAKMLWDVLLAITEASWVFPRTVCQLLLAWQSASVGKKRKRIWMAAPLCLFWTLWLERNRVVFENEAPSVHRLKSSFLFTLWGWARATKVDNSISLVGFLAWMGCR